MDLLKNQLLQEVYELSSPFFEGREMGTEGAARARSFLVERFREIGLRSWNGRFEHTTIFEPAAVNLLGWIPGQDPELPWLVLLAHYDHLGIRDGELYPGADDNASGVGAVLYAARRLVREGPLRSVLVALPDGEEKDQVGSRCLVEEGLLPVEELGLVINLDMLGRSDSGGLWVAGVSHHPELEELLEVGLGETPSDVQRGHDTPSAEDSRYDWTWESDHAAFHRVGLPWLYFGIEDHPDYHSPRDTFERLDLDFLIASTETVTEFVLRCACEPLLEQLEALRSP